MCPQAFRRAAKAGAGYDPKGRGCRATIIPRGGVTARSAGPGLGSEFTACLPMEICAAASA
jgi:hypothetical protein